MPLMLALSVLFAGTCLAAAQPPIVSTHQVHREIPYAKQHPRQVLDLYIPKTEKPPEQGFPLLLYIHGGGFKKGSKDQAQEWGVHEILQKLQIAGASMNYRFTSSHPYPAQIHDTRLALNHLRSSIADEHRINPDRVALIGESAGGYLVNYLGLSHNKEIASPVIKAVISIHGMYDMPLFVSQPSTQDYSREPTAPTFMYYGQSHLDCPKTVRQSSPSRHLSAHAPPFLLIHGDEDRVVHRQQSLLLRQHLRRQGTPVSLLTLQRARHQNLLGPDYLNHCLQFLHHHLLEEEASPPKDEAVTFHK